MYATCAPRRRKNLHPLEPARLRRRLLQSPLVSSRARQDDVDDRRAVQMGVLQSPADRAVATATATATGTGWVTTAAGAAFWL
jgi:hypothetical protein